MLAYTILKINKAEFRWLLIIGSVFADLQASLMAIEFYSDITAIATLKYYHHYLLNKWYYEPLIIHHIEQ